jgi:hypothetical protein
LASLISSVMSPKFRVSSVTERVSASTLVPSTRVLPKVEWSSAPVILSSSFVSRKANAPRPQW